MKANCDAREQEKLVSMIIQPMLLSELQGYKITLTGTVVDGDAGRQCISINIDVPSSSDSNEILDRELLLESCNRRTNLVKEPVAQKLFPAVGQAVPTKPSNKFSFDGEDLDIPWSDLVLKERIGSGIFSLVGGLLYSLHCVLCKLVRPCDYS